MTNGDIALLAWNDYVGLTRCRGIPAGMVANRLVTGLGWSVSGQALTPFGDIAPNPWGPTSEVRQIPVEDSAVRVDIWPDAPAFHMYLCDAKTADGTDWDCCTRAFMRHAMDDLRSETGLEFMAAFEHEFLLQSDGLPAGAAFSLKIPTAYNPACEVPRNVRVQCWTLHYQRHDEANHNVNKIAA